LTEEDKDRIFKSTRDAAYEIIQRKGATFYAVAAALTRLVQAILRDQQTILTVSSLINDYYDINDVCLSLPTIVGRDGIERILKVDLSEDEIEKVKHSAATLRKYIESVDDLR
jgi:L-lactate dehydrogenase